MMLAFQFLETLLEGKCAWPLQAPQKFGPLGGPTTISKSCFHNSQA